MEAEGESNDHGLDSRKNQILGALPKSVLRALNGDMELVALPGARVIYEAGDELAHAYFPIDGVVSLQYVMESGDSTEIAMVGNDGLLGVGLLMGATTAHGRAVVQSGGHAYRLGASVLKTEFERHAPLQQALMRYIQVLLTQMAQTVVCNRHHAVEQRICRWLLMAWDRQQSNELNLTHEMFAGLLGVTRKTVTQAAGALQDAGLIQYRRGKIAMPDRARLEERACECYAVVKQESSRLLPGNIPD